MKRFFVLSLTLVLILSLVACVNNENTSTNNSSVSTNNSSSTQDTQHTEMNFKQIQAGDYSSLLGTWMEVAYSDNRFDGTGQQWHTGGNPFPTLSVSTDKIAFNGSGMVMQRNTITDEAGSHPIRFVNSEGSLTADFDDSNTAIYWAVKFYPKGIANDFEPNNGVKIDNTKNLIVIWYSGMQRLTVFAQTNASN